MKLYRGPLRWIDRPNEPQRWEGPPGAALLDTRPISEMAKSGGPEQACLFASESPIADTDYDLIADGDLAKIRPTGRMIQSLRFGRYQPVGDSVASLVADLFLGGSDPDGIDGPRPLVPSGGRFVLSAGRDIFDEPFKYGTGPRTAMVRTAIQRKMSAAVDQADGGEITDTKLRQILGYELRKYGIPYAEWREFVPVQLQSRFNGAFEPETTVSDNFSGSLSGWGNATGTWAIASGAAYKSADFNLSQTIVYSTSLSGSDHYSQVKIVGGTSTDIPAPICRKPNSTTQTYYFCGNYSNVLYLTKIVSGSQTNLNSIAYTFATGDTYKVEAIGSAIKGYTNATLQLSVTDTSIPGNTHVGMYQYGTTVAGTMDDFEGADVSGGLIYTMLERTTRGVLRGMYTRG